MDRVNPIVSQVEQITSDLRIQGFCSVYSKDFDADKIRAYLFNEFKSLLYIEVDDTRKYIIVDNTGKEKVIKFIESSMYYAKRAMIDAEKYNRPTEKYTNEIRTLERLKRTLEKSKL